MATPSLLGLPPELQNRIYHLVLVKASDICMLDEEQRREENSVLALLWASSEIYETGKRIYYGLNVFVFSNSDRMILKRLEAFVTVLDAKTIGLCRRVKLRVSRDCLALYTCPAGNCTCLYEINFLEETVRVHPCSHAVPGTGAEAVRGLAIRMKQGYLVPLFRSLIKTKNEQLSNVSISRRRWSLVDNEIRGI